MPVVSKTHYPAHDEPGYMKIIKVDAEGEFSIVLPRAVSRVLGFNVVKGATKDAVERAFRKAIEDCNTACTRERKVIGYTIDKSFGSSFAEGISVNLAAQVFVEETVSLGTGDERKRYEVVPDNTLPDRLVEGTFAYDWPQKAHIIDHTPEREDFFRRLGEALLAVVNQINRMEDVTRAVSYADGVEPFLALPGHTCTPGEGSTVCTICGA